MTTPAPGPARKPTLSLRTPAEILTAVPYLLGFQPDRSLVVVGLSGSRQRVGLTQRVDWPPGELAMDAVDVMVGHLEQHGFDRALVVAYLDEQQPGDAAPDEVWAALQVAFDCAVGGRGIEVREALVVRQGRWRSWLCRRSSCCPPEGTAFDEPDTQVAATATFAGMAVRPSRDSLVAELQPVAGRLQWSDVASAAGELGGAAGRRTTLALVSAALRDGGPLDDELLARVLAGVRDVRTRDAAYALSAGDWLPETTIDDLLSDSSEEPLLARAQRFWADAVRRAPAGDVAAAATVLGAVSWHLGDGARALVAFDRALADDPGYRLALLLEELVLQATRPPEGPVLTVEEALSGARSTARGLLDGPVRGGGPGESGDRKVG